MKIEKVNYSLRIYYALKRAKIDTVEQLQAMPDEKLLMLRGVGAVTLAAIREKVPFTGAVRRHE